MGEKGGKEIGEVKRKEEAKVPVGKGRRQKGVMGK